MADALRLVHSWALLPGLVFLGSQCGDSQLLELWFRAVSPGADQQAMHQCTVRNEALVDSLAPVQDALVFEDPPGAQQRRASCMRSRDHAALSLQAGARDVRRVNIAT